MISKSKIMLLGRDNAWECGEVGDAGYSKPGEEG